MMNALRTVEFRFYKVKQGQTLREIAAYFSVSEFALADLNGLSEEPQCGEILEIPRERGNAYLARAGDTKAFLCGSEESYARKNGTAVLYPGMRVIL